MTKYLLLIVSFCFFIPFSHGQLDYVLSGIVKDSDSGEPLISATIEACDLITTTDLEGKFSLQVSNKTCLLQVRYLGYEIFQESIDLPQEDGEEFIVFLTPSRNILNQAVITANKFQQKRSESTVSLEVIKADLVSSSNKPSADEVLDMVPGVDVIDGQANIRGGAGFSYGSGSRVLLVIDDMPALQFDGGNARWDDIAIENIQQIEVLKGASSVLYGSSALNGVIHFTSAEPSKDPKTKAGISYRHYMAPEDPKRQWWDSAPYETSMFVTHSRKIKKLDLTAGLFFNRLDSYNQFTEEKRGRAFIRAKYKIKPSMYFSLNADYNVADNSAFFYWGNALRKSFQPGDNTITLSKIDRFKIDPVLSWYDKNKNKHTLKSRWYSASSVNNNDQTVKSDFQYLAYNYRHSFDGINAKLVFGIEGLANQTEAALYSNTNYTGYNLAGFLQWNQKLWKSLNYVIGARYEMNALENPDFSYEVDGEIFDVEAKQLVEAKPVFRAGLNYEARKGTYLRGSIGQAYRYPTIAEKFTSTVAGGLTIIPNPELSSETGWSTEFGVRQELKFNILSMYVDLAAFHSRYNNMMEFTLSDRFLGGFEARNVGNTILWGLDNSVGLQWDIGALKIQAMVAYTFVDPKYADYTEEIKNSATSDDNILKYRYRHSLKSQLNIELWGVSFWVNQRYNSHMVSIDRNFEQYISGIADFRNNFNSGYNILNMQLAYKYKYMRFSLNMDNVANTLYTERPALLEAPRNVSIRLEFDISHKTK